MAPAAVEPGFMASWTGVVIFVVAFVLAIVIGEKFKKNSGMIALVFAFIIGCAFCTLSAKNMILKTFPLDVFYVMFIITFFYGFMHESGFVKGLSDRMIYACRNHPALLAPAFLVCAFVMAAMGGDTAAFLVLAPLAFGLAFELGFNPILAIIAVQGGASLGGYMPWTMLGSMQIGMFEGLFGSHPEGVAAHMGFTLTVAVNVIVLFFATYFITKGHKVSKMPDLKAPEPFNKDQKKSLVLMICVLVCVIIFPLLNLIFKGNKFISGAARFLDVRSVFTIGAVIAMFLKLGDERKVFSQRVPWSLIFMVAGMMSLIALASQPEVGTIDFVTGLIKEGLNPTIVVLILFVAACLLGAVTAGITVLSLLLAIVPPLAAASGLPGYVLMACALCGVHGMSIGPYSSGGAMALSGCPDEHRSSVIRKQYLIMIIQAVLLLVLVLIGVPKFFAGLFV